MTITNEQESTVPGTRTSLDLAGGCPGVEAARCGGGAESCPCGAATRERLLAGGLPFALEVVMSVAGMPGAVLAEVSGTVGKVYAVPPALGEDGGAVPSIRAVAPTPGELFRTAADQLEGMVPHLRTTADQLDAEHEAAERARAAEAGVSVVKCPPECCPRDTPAEVGGDRRCDQDTAQGGAGCAGQGEAPAGPGCAGTVNTSGG